MKISRHSRRRGTRTHVATATLLLTVIALAFSIGLTPEWGLREVLANPATARLTMVDLLDLLLHPKVFDELTVTYPPEGLDIVVPSGDEDTHLTVVALSNDPAATTTVGFGIDGDRTTASRVYHGPIFGPNVSLGTQNFVSDQPYSTTFPFSFLSPLVGAHELYALGNLSGVATGGLMYAVISEPVYFNVTQVAATTDVDDDGLPDDPFNLVDAGTLWAATGASGREVMVANLDPGTTGKAVSPSGGGVAILMSNLTVEAPTREELVDAGLIEADSQALLVVSSDASLDGLLGDSDWADAMLESAPATLIGLDLSEDDNLPLKQFFEISIIYTINGGTQYRELNTLTNDLPVRITMDDLANSANGQNVALWSFDTEIRDAQFNGDDVLVIGEVDGAGWKKAAPYQTLSGGRLSIELTSLSTFAPFGERILVTSITPNEGPHDESQAAVIDGRFLLSGTMSLAQAQAQYRVYIGGVLAEFDDSSGPVVTPTSIRVIVPPRPDLTVTASVDVTVVELDDPLHADTLANGYTYAVSPPPTISSVTPGAGPLEGGTVVTVTGTAFLGATEVRFGGVPGANLEVLSNTEIRVTTPAHAAGPVDVTVEAPGGTATLNNAFTYVRAPQILFISPVEGPVTGGTEVTITGTDFSSVGLQVAFGDETASVLSQSSTKIVVSTPAQTAGTVDVTVTSAGGSSTLANAFTYVAVGAAPTISEVTPAQGPATGGTTVTITGANFELLQVVSFGGSPAAVTSMTSNQLVVVTSGHAPGVVDVVVRTLNGTATQPQAFTYTAVGGPPTITNIQPDTGLTSGGTAVTISGTNLSTTQSVTFGGVPATNLTIVSSTRVDVVTPAHNAGPVDVVVTTAGGQTTRVDGFTYRDPRVNVFSVSPDRAWAFGGVVTRITGQGFTQDADGSPTVTFGGVAAEILETSDSELLVVVPPRLLPDGGPAENPVDVVVSKSVGGTMYSGTRNNGFIYQRFVRRSETFGMTTDVVITTAFYLDGGAGSHEVVLGTHPSIPKGRIDVPQGAGLGNVGVLVRTTKSPSVFGLTNLTAGVVVPNVWYYDVHFYRLDQVGMNPGAGDLTYEEIAGLEFDRGEPAPTIHIPVGDTDLLASQFDQGRIALFGLDSQLMAQPLGTPSYSLNSMTGEYQSQPLLDEFTLDNDGKPAHVVSRIYQSGAFGLRNDVLPDLNALNLRLDETEHPDGTAEGPIAGGTRVVLVADGGLGWVDRVVFRVGSATAEAEILTDQGENEFLLVVESPEVPKGGDAVIEIYLRSNPATIAGELDGVFSYEGGIGPCFIATAAYGTPMAREVNVLRAFRDRFLLTNAPGIAFVDTYYHVSPALADVIAERPALAAAVRVMLVPVILIARLAMWSPLLLVGAIAIAGVWMARRRTRRLAAL